MKIRISLVNYLNSAPLGWAFLHGPFRDKFEVFSSSPALCADQLFNREVEVGLIPSIEYQRMPGLQVIPGISISSLAEVRSILLVRPKGKKQINSVALDASSRTSVALTKILFNQKFGVQPEFVPHPPDLYAMLNQCDAAMLIGDAALKVSLEDYETMDLAGEWVKWQKKPFLCAFWACRSDSSIPKDLSAIFQEAKEWGLKRRSEIAKIYAETLGLPVSFLEFYLEKNINFDMGADHIKGVEKFYSLAKQLDLIPEHRPLQLL